MLSVETIAKYTYLIHIIVPILLAIIINIIMNRQKLYIKDYETNKYLPPGYIIGIVWVIILGFLGYAHYLKHNSLTSAYIIIIIIYCLSYPFLTYMKSEEEAQMYNLIAVILAITLFITVFIDNMYDSLYILPFLLWCIYVFIVTTLLA
jgi:tryptophan-rich sensory protein